MNIALISSRYRPETSPGAKRASDLAAALRSAGHRVTVLTQLPSYPDATAFEPVARAGHRVAVEEEGTGEVIWRFAPQLVSRDDLLRRLIAEARFARRVSRSRTGLSDIDGVVASTPFVFNLLAARSYPAPVWLDVRDLTWEYARQLGRPSRLRALGAVTLRSLALSSLRAARGVSTTTEAQRDYLVARGVHAAKVHVVPNGVPRRVIDELGRLAEDAASPPGSPLRVVYAGLLGFPQGLEFVVRSVEELASAGVELHLYGDGVDRQRLAEYCAARDLRHVRLHGHVDHEAYLGALAGADVLLASLRPEVRTALPSKLLEYMAAGKPIVFVGSGEGAAVVDEAGAGISIPYGETRALQERLIALSRDATLGRQLGANGRDWVIRHRVREEINARWVEILEDAFGGRAETREASVEAASGPAPGTNGRSWLRKSFRSAAPWVARGAEAIGLLRALEWKGARQSPRLAVLTYHRVTEPGGAHAPAPGLLSATPAAFAGQMELLATRYHVVSMEEVLESFRRGGRLPHRAVLVTFDDAYADFTDHAWPVLRALGIPVTLFVPTGFPDRSEPGFWWDRLYQGILATGSDRVDSPWGAFTPGDRRQRLDAYRWLRDRIKETDHARAMEVVDRLCDQLGEQGPTASVLSWDTLRSLARDGVTLGAHTRSHAFLDRLPPAEARAEVEGSLADLAREIGSVLPVFAYPGGRHDASSVQAVAEAGVELAFTTRGGVNVLAGVDRLRLRRIHVGVRTTSPILRARLAGVRPPW